MAFPTLDYNLVRKSETPSALGYEAVQNVHVEKAITTAMLASGIVTALIRMPANTRYVDLYAKSTDLDTGGSPALAIDIGIVGIDSTAQDDVDCFLDGSTIGQAGTGGDQVMLQAGVGLLVTQPHYITFTAATAAATAAAGTFTLGIQCVIEST